MLPFLPTDAIPNPPTTASTSTSAATTAGSFPVVGIVIVAIAIVIALGLIAFAVVSSRRGATGRSTDRAGGTA